MNNSKYKNRSNNNNNNNNNFICTETDQDQYYNNYVNYVDERTNVRQFENKKIDYHKNSANQHQLTNEQRPLLKQTKPNFHVDEIPVHDLFKPTRVRRDSDYATNQMFYQNQKRLQMQRNQTQALNQNRYQYQNQQQHLLPSQHQHQHQQHQQSNAKTQTHSPSGHKNPNIPLYLNYEAVRLYGGKSPDKIYSSSIKKSHITENIKRINNAYRNDRKSISPPLVQQFDASAFPVPAHNHKTSSNNNNIRFAYQTIYQPQKPHKEHKEPQQQPKQHSHGKHHRHQSTKTEPYTEDINRNHGKNQSLYKAYKPATDEHYKRYYYYEYNRSFASPKHQNKLKALPLAHMDPFNNPTHLDDKNIAFSAPTSPIKAQTKKKYQKNEYVIERANFSTQTEDENGFIPDIEVIKGCGDINDGGKGLNDTYERKPPNETIKIDRTPYPPLQSRSSTYLLNTKQNVISNDNLGHKIEGSSEIKKVSSSTRKAKGPRVLLYNTASPRLQRKPSSGNLSGRLYAVHHRSVLTDQKRNMKLPTVIANRIRVKDTTKSGDMKVECFAIRPENEKDSLNVSGDHLRSNGVILKKEFIIEKDHHKKNPDGSSASEDEDDLDNASDFIVSDDSDTSTDAEEGYRVYALKNLQASEKYGQLHSSISPQTSEESIRTPTSLLVPSLFPHVPPYLSFSSNVEKGPDVPPELHRILKWRVSNVMPKVVRCVLANSGMRLVKKTNEWIGVWGKHMKSPCFKAIRPYQKINHLPGSFKIGRKDSCWKNLKKNMGKHSKRDFGFMPKTYIIPNDLHSLRKHWPRYAQQNLKWIIKPPASARGFGIRVVNRWAQIPKRKPLIVQRYIERPLLINGSKFDLRLYVLVTSINPLRVFLYHNGLARFASVKYSDRSETLGDRCMHLTNYSINKFSSNYSKNDDVNACHGHKWTLKSLWTYLARRGVQTDGLWEAMRSLVLRTILAGESTINNMVKYNVESKYSCYELFGFDVILDSQLIPWLLEVNISPSLHSDLPLDAHVKAPLVQGVLNTALFNIPPKLTVEKQREIAQQMNYRTNGPFCFDKRMHVKYLSREEKAKHEYFTRKSLESRDEYLHQILEHLTPDDVRTLIIAEDELARCAPLERIFPTKQSHKYLKFTDNPRYYNRLLDAWETRYGNNRQEGINLLRKYCEAKYHLQVPPPPAKRDSSDESTDHEQQTNTESNSNQKDQQTEASESKSPNSSSQTISPYKKLNDKQPEQSDQ